MEKRKEKVIMKYLLTFESYTFEDFTYSDMEDVKELLEEGHSAEQIAIELDFSLDKVKQIIYSLKKSGQISDSNLSEKKAYKGAKGGLDKWFREKWVDISKTNADGSHPPCGRDDADKGGYLDLDEISLPLISLGLSTDAGFVEKLIRSLKQNKGGPKQVPNPKTKDRKAAKEAGMIVEDLTFTLKDFVSIFKADKIGEKISQIVLDECRVRQEKKFSEG